MLVLSTLLFFVYLFGFGFSATRFLKEAEHPLERIIMRLGIGLAVFQVVGILLNVLHVPLDWRVFLLLSLVVPAYVMFRARKISVPRLALTRTNLFALGAVLLFLFSLFMYATGAFSYPYLEDDDPWGHAFGATYVAVEKTVQGSPHRGFQYIDPYPPGYDLTMGVLHQTNDSVYATLKFFNALIIALGILFFYFMALRLMRHHGKALFATFVLAAVPAYLSHFIWAHALVVTLFFPVMYAVLMMEHDRRWFVVAALGVASFTFVQPTQPVKLLALLFIYVAVLLASMRRLVWQYVAFPFLGLAVSLLWWATRWRSFSSAAQEARLGEEAVQAATPLLPKLVSTFFAFFDPTSGTATRVYTFSDFFIAQGQNMINNPVGLGVAVSLLAIVGVVVVLLRYKSLLQPKKAYLLVLLLWAVFTFLGVNSLTFNLPVGLFAFRFWMLLAIPVALLAAEGLWFFVGAARQWGVPALAVIAIAVVAVFLTAGMQKYEINTAPWPPGAFWTSSEELQAYMWLGTLPRGTQTFAFTADHQVIAFGNFMCSWCADEAAMRERGTAVPVDDLYDWLRVHGYAYLIVSGMDVRSYGQNETLGLIQDFSNLEGVRVAHQTPGAVIFSVAP